MWCVSSSSSSLVGPWIFHSLWNAPRAFCILFLISSLPPPFFSTIAPRYANSSTSFTSSPFTTMLSLLYSWLNLEPVWYLPSVDYGAFKPSVYPHYHSHHLARNSIAPSGVPRAFSVYRIEGFFSKSTKSVCRLPLQSFACSKMFL